jgi:hypothetical protein
VKLSEPMIRVDVYHNEIIDSITPINNEFLRNNRVILVIPIMSSFDSLGNNYMVSIYK